MDDYVENILAENNALRRKLQSKAEALLILSKELDGCRRERDQFQLMAEQLQQRHVELKKLTLHLNPSPLLSSAIVNTYPNNCDTLLSLENTEELKQQLNDAHGDIKALRAQLVELKKESLCFKEDHDFTLHQKQEMVHELEKMSLKNTHLSRDLQALLDEKEELILQRDRLRCKVHRLNFELNTALALTKDESKNKSKIDIDAIVTENLYLHERIQQAEQEKEFATQSITKYKSMLDKKRNKGAIKLGNSNNTGMLISHKQVQQLLLKSVQLPATAAALSDMQGVCIALLEALNDKSTALTHQRKTNRVLGRRVAELERKLGAEGTIIYPSQILLAGYSGADVDKEVDQILAAAENEEPSSPSTNNSDSTNISMRECIEENDTIGNHEDDDALPPQLQEMVLKALDDIKKESLASENGTENQRKFSL